MNYDLLKNNFSAHGFETKYFDNAAEAAEYLSQILKGETIGFGGSVTLHEMGLYEKLSQKNLVVWHHKIAGEKVRALAARTNVYITSANGVSETGELVNIDGAGNRIAMTLYGPERVFYIVGKNKIEKDRESAVYRAKNVAAPKNAQRLKMRTPCASKGDRCYDCQVPERICRCTLIIDRAPHGTRSEIIFVDEDMGY